MTTTRYFCQYCLHGCIRGIEKPLGKMKESSFQKLTFRFTFCHPRGFQAIIIKFLHHPILATGIMWKLHLCEMQWWTILWSTPTEYRGWRRWKFFDQVLPAATICIQHMANKISMKGWLKNNEGDSIMPPTAESVPNHSSQQIKMSVIISGEYRGPVHNTCNLNYHIDPKKVKTPCIIHNLKGIFLLRYFSVKGIFLSYSYFHDC